MAVACRCMPSQLGNDNCTGHTGFHWHDLIASMRSAKKPHRGVVPILWQWTEVQSLIDGDYLYTPLTSDSSCLVCIYHTAVGSARIARISRSRTLAGWHAWLPNGKPRNLIHTKHSSSRLSRARTSSRSRRDHLPIERTECWDGCSAVHPL